LNDRASLRDSTNKAFYDADSESYDQERWTSRAGRLTNQIQQQILSDLCADWVEKRVLEVGPGTARFSIPLLRRKNRMTLLDISSGMLRKAAANIEAANLSSYVEAYKEGSIYDLPFEDGSFDHAISLNVFNHLERPADALCQLARVIQPGSTLLFNYANLHSYYWPVARQINKRKKAVARDVYSTWEKPREVARFIRAAGLELVRLVGHVHVPQALEAYPVTGVVRVLDFISRRDPLSRFAPFHFCLCRKIA